MFAAVDAADDSAAAVVVVVVVVMAHTGLVPHAHLRLALKILRYHDDAALKWPAVSPSSMPIDVVPWTVSIHECDVYSHSAAAFPSRHQHWVSHKTKTHYFPWDCYR